MNAGYHDDSVLWIRCCGGLGDILMHRLLAQSMKEAHPGMKLVFALPTYFHAAVSDHRAIDEIVDWANVNPELYAIRYDTSTICARYESMTAPSPTLHRCEIWAAHCGIPLRTPSMDIRLTREETEFGQRIVSQFGRSGQRVCFAPKSSTLTRDLNPHQISGIEGGLRARGFGVFGLHTHMIPGLTGPTVHKLNIRQWMAVIQASDYVVAVDSAPFHCGGGLGKPTLGIFGYMDGHVRGWPYPNYRIVQRHRDTDPDWCGPCVRVDRCQKAPHTQYKPCMTELTVAEILEGFDRLTQGAAAA